MDGARQSHKSVRFEPSVKHDPDGAGAASHDGGDGRFTSGFLGQPSHHWLLGKFAPYTGPGSVSHPCACYRKFVARGITIGPHARWDCPLRYIAQCGYCPGFNHEGLRLPGAWHDDDWMTKETVEAWKQLIATKGLAVAHGAPGPPRFP